MTEQFNVGDLVTINESAWFKDIVGSTRKVESVDYGNLMVDGKGTKYPSGIFLDKKDVTLAAPALPEFKKGDRVKVSDDAWALPGKTGVVNRGPDFDGDYWVEIDGMATDSYFPADEITLVVPEFKVGDKVKVAEGARSWFDLPSSGAGKVGEYKGEAVDHPGFVRVKPLPDQPHFSAIVKPEDLTLVEEEAEAPAREFKVGDLVKIADDAKNSWGRESSGAGQEGAISKLDFDKGGYALVSNAHIVHPRDLTLVEEVQPDPEAEAPKFKAGDKVKIGSEPFYREFGNDQSFDSDDKDMLAGQVTTVTDGPDKDGDYRVDVSYGLWVAPESLTLVTEEEQSLTLKFDGFGSMPTATQLVDARNAGILDREQVRQVLASAETFDPGAVNLLHSEGIVTTEEAKAFYAGVLGN